MADYSQAPDDWRKCGCVVRLKIVRRGDALTLTLSQRERELASLFYFYFL